MTDYAWRQSKVTTPWALIVIFKQIPSFVLLQNSLHLNTSCLLRQFIYSRIVTTITINSYIEHELSDSKNKAKKKQAWTGIKPTGSAIPVQCSTNWAIKPTGGWSRCEFAVYSYMIKTSNRLYEVEILIKLTSDLIDFYLAGPSDPLPSLLVWRDQVISASISGRIGVHNLQEDLSEVSLLFMLFCRAWLLLFPSFSSALDFLNAVSKQFKRDFERA